MKNYINLTQHVSTPEQGVEEPGNKEEVKRLLTFTSIPTSKEIRERASKLAYIAENELFRIRIKKLSLSPYLEYTPCEEYAMIGGAPYLMSSLEEELIIRGITPVYSFTERNSTEETIDGKTVKKSVFQHIGFVEMTGFALLMVDDVCPYCHKRGCSNFYGNSEYCGEEPGMKWE